MLRPLPQLTQDRSCLGSWISCSGDGPSDNNVGCPSSDGFGRSDHPNLIAMSRARGAHPGSDNHEILP